MILAVKILGLKLESETMGSALYIKSNSIWKLIAPSCQLLIITRRMHISFEFIVVTEIQTRWLSLYCFQKMLMVLSKPSLGKKRCSDFPKMRKYGRMLIGACLSKCDSQTTLIPTLLIVFRKWKFGLFSINIRPLYPAISILHVWYEGWVFGSAIIYI